MGVGGDRKRPTGSLPIRDTRCGPVVVSGRVFTKGEDGNDCCQGVHSKAEGETEGKRKVKRVKTKVKDKMKKEKVKTRNR